MRLSVAGKGLFLVAVPLIFEFVFVGGLVSSLKQAEAQVDRQLRSQALIEQTTILMRELVTASYGMCFRYLSTQAPPNPEDSKHGVLDTLQNLDKFVQSDISMKQHALQIRRAVDTFYLSLGRFAEMTPSDLMYGLSGGKALQEMRKDLQLLDRSVRKFRLYAQAAAEMDEKEASSIGWKRLSVAGVALSLVLTIVLALSFARSISFRLRKLAANTGRVALGLSPLPPLGGADEVADLDMVIHKMSAQLRQAEKQRSQLSSMLKSKLAEPLNDARAVLTGLGESTASPPAAKNAVKKASQLLERLLRLLDDLTTIEQIESGRIELNKADLSSQELVSKAVESVQSIAAKKNIEIKQSGQEHRFTGDQHRLMQVLINLLSNAIKFSPEESEIVLSVTLSGGETGQKNSELEFRVKDNGPGIPREMQSKIFERYEQSKREDATTKGGAGLGLNICAVIASSHGARLGVDSEPGKGSEFWLRLPFGTAASAEPGASLIPQTSLNSLPGKPGQGQGSRIRGMKIWQKGLIVVSVPLIFQLGFVLVLTNLIEKAQNQTIREMHAQTISTIVNEMYRVVVNLAATAGGDYVAGTVSKVERGSHSREITGLLNQMALLFSVEQDDPIALQQVSQVFHSSERVLINTSKLMLDPPPGKTIGTLALVKKRVAAIERSHVNFAESISKLLRKQQEIERESPALLEKTREQIALVLAASLVLSVIISLLLGLYFSKNISKRLGVLIENTLSFTAGKTDLLPPLKGADELSEFDADFRQMLQRINENQEFKKHILAVVSHELRTPLTSISGSMMLLNDGAYGALDADESAKVTQAQNDILLVIQLVNDLLDIERMEAAKFPMEIQQVELAESVAAGIALAKKSNAKLDCVFNSQSDKNPVISADPDLLSKAISKLLLFCSACDGENGSLRIELSCKESELTLQVPDQADWLSQGDLQVFEKFQLLERTQIQEKQGVALSLALAKTILHEMGFEISSIPPSDNKGKGAFLIHIPLSYVAPPQVAC